MAVTFQNKDEFAGRVYPFHVEPVKRDVMGYRLTDVEKDTIVPQGTPIVADMDNKTAVICKHAKVTKKVSTTKFIVEYVGFLAVGDKVFCSGEATPTLSEISAIDKTTKEITLKAANTQLDVDKILVEGTTGEGSAIVAKNVPNRIVARTQKMTEIDKTVSATHQAIVIQNVVDFPAEWLNTETFPGSTLLKGCPLILFVKQ